MEGSPLVLDSSDSTRERTARAKIASWFRCFARLCSAVVGCAARRSETTTALRSVFRPAQPSHATRKRSGFRERARIVAVVSLLPVLACKGEETPLEPADERLNGTWFSQEIPGATLTIDLDDESAIWTQFLVGTFDPNASPNELNVLGNTYVGITQGLNDNSNLTPGETYADGNHLEGVYPSSTFDVVANDRYILRQHLGETASLGLRYTFALPTFFVFEMPFLLMQTDEGRVTGNAEWLHFDGSLDRYVLSYTLTPAGARPTLELLGFAFEGEPGGVDVASGSPWILDDRDETGLLVRLVADADGLLLLELELYFSFGGILPPLGPLWGTAMTFRYHDDAAEQELSLYEHEPFQQYAVHDIDDDTFSLRLALWSLAEGHCSWTTPTVVGGQTGLVFIESPNPLAGAAGFDTLPVYTPLGEVDGAVGAWVNPDSGHVVTFSTDGRWASTTGANGHWREDGDRIYYAEERIYQR